MDLVITQNWNDERLQFNRSIFPFPHLSFRDHSRLWKPDLYVVNEANAEHRTFDRPNQIISIEPNGEVVWRLRTTLSLFCEMDLRFYPFDKQICSIVIASCECRHWTRLGWAAGQFDSE